MIDTVSTYPPVHSMSRLVPKWIPLGHWHHLFYFSVITKVLHLHLQSPCGWTTCNTLSQPALNMQPTAHLRVASVVRWSRRADILTPRCLAWTVPHRGQPCAVVPENWKATLFVLTIEFPVLYTTQIFSFCAFLSLCAHAVSISSQSSEKVTCSPLLRKTHRYRYGNFTTWRGLVASSSSSEPEWITSQLQRWAYAGANNIGDWHRLHRS